MRTRIVATCGFVVAIICLLLWLRQRTEPETNTPLVNRPTPTNAAGLNEPGQPSQQWFSNGSVQPTQVTRANVASHTSSATASNALTQRALTEWQVPIDFYGKVVDDNSNAVVGAQVQFSWIEAPTENGEKRGATETDSAGLFSLNGKRGASLQVLVGKDGYYTSRKGADVFHYAVMGKFDPDPQNPVVFRLRRKGQGERLVHVGGSGLRTMRDFLLAPDGNPTEVSLYDGRSVPVGQGDLRVEFRAGQALENFPSRMTWQCRVTVPGGGLVQTDEEYPFLAPESGYSSSDEWSVDATNWTEQIQKVYYVKLRDGNFGRATVRVIGTPRRTFFRLESFLNPSGSQNLEPNE